MDMCLNHLIGTARYKLLGNRVSGKFMFVFLSQQLPTHNEICNKFPYVDCIFAEIIGVKSLNKNVLYKIPGMIFFVNIRHTIEPSILCAK